MLGHVIHRRYLDDNNQMCQNANFSLHVGRLHERPEALVVIQLFSDRLRHDAFEEGRQVVVLAGDVAENFRTQRVYAAAEARSIWVMVRYRISSTFSSGQEEAALTMHIPSE